MFGFSGVVGDGGVPLIRSDIPFPLTAVIVFFLLLSLVLQRRRIQIEQRKYADELRLLKRRSKRLRKGNAGLKYENRLLRLFLSNSTARRIARVVLRHVVPKPRDGFAFVIQWIGDEQHLIFSRGLGEKSKCRIHIPGVLMERLMEEHCLQLENRSLHETGIPELLSPRDRSKVDRLFVAAAVESGQMTCVLVSTRLPLSPVKPDRQMELLRELMIGLGNRLSSERDFDIQKNQLRLTADMLQLRSIADRSSESPTSMIREYLSSLLHLLQSDQIAFFLHADSFEGNTNIIRCGETLPTEIAARWHDQEERLFDGCRSRTTLAAMSRTELQRMEVLSMIGSAMVVPLLKGDRPIAHICFTRKRREPFSDSQRDLAAWAAQDFTKAIHRLLHHLTASRHARIDSLTELANRRVFDQRIEREWDRARATGEPCSLLLLDLDRFKRVNDVYGHQAGDLVLQEVSRVLKERFRETRRDDEVLLARYGGEELAVLLPGMDHGGAMKIAELLRAEIEEAKLSHGEQTIRVTASIGVSTFPDHAKTVKEMIGTADAALYAAKQAGRNAVHSAAQIPRERGVSLSVSHTT